MGGGWSQEGGESIVNTAQMLIVPVSPSQHHDHDDLSPTLFCSESSDTSPGAEQDYIWEHNTPGLLLSVLLQQESLI